VKVDNLSIGRVFSTGGDVQYILPHFQREYTWGKQEWDMLLKDIVEVYQEYNQDPAPEHFMGSLVVIESGMTEGIIPVLTLVDGQQRLTTISLLLAALLAHVQRRPEFAQLTNRLRRLLVNDVEPGRNAFLKVLPTLKYGDRMAYRAIIAEDIDDSDRPTTSNIQAAYTYLRREVERHIANDRIEPEKLYTVIFKCLQVVLINLSHDESPYRIFESLNFKGKALTQADLVRNYIAMRLPVQQQEYVFTHDWQHIEERLQEQREVGRIGELTAFIRHYLSLDNGNLCNEDHVYARFRDRMERPEYNPPEAFIGEIATLRRFAMYYDRFLCPEHEPRPAIRLRLARLRILETSTSYPFLLKLFDAADTGNLDESDLAAALDIIENYFIRRYFLGETQYVNRMFPTLCRDIQAYDATLPDTLRQMLATRRCPTDQEVRDAVRKRSLYVQSRTFNAKRLCAVLERINAHLSEGRDAITVLQGDPTIEHIMPQTLSDDWRRELGEDADQINSEFGSTLGNLTLVTQSYNSHLSNHPYATKVAALAQHGLLLNEAYFADPPAVWDADAIRHRADFLADHILAIWPSLGPAYVKSSQERQAITKPAVLKIGDENFAVKSWRDVVRQTIEYAIQQDRFDAVRRAIPAHLQADVMGAKSGPQWAVLSNRWRVNVNVSGYQARGMCRRIFAEMGMSETGWHIEEEEATNGK
jgi:uncharacterized protein with ParB-like and HNH nuclease domain